MGLRRRIIDFFKRSRRAEPTQRPEPIKRTPLEQHERNSLNAITKFLRFHIAELPELVRVHNELLRTPRFYEGTLKTNIDQMEAKKQQINNLNLSITKAKTITERIRISDEIKSIQHGFEELKLENLLILANHFKPTQE